MMPFTVMSRIGKSIEKKVDQCSPGSVGRGGWGLTTNWYGVSFGGGQESVLELVIMDTNSVTY